LDTRLRDGHFPAKSHDQLVLRADEDANSVARIEKSHLATDMPHVNEVRDELSRVLGSPGFRDSPQLVRFLTFVVEATLAGKADTIKGYTIAIEALGRGSDFDPEADAIVRVEAGRLRLALARYYAGAGASDPLQIDLPRGTYVPAFRTRTFVESPTATPPTIEALRLDNQRIRDSIVSLAATLLRNMAVDPFRDHRDLSSADAEHLLREAEECFRCARGLEAAGHEFMAKAVEIETVVQRGKSKK
jgi:hypothetical protein